MTGLWRLLVALAASLIAGSAAAAELPAPWVELAANGELSIRTAIAAGAPCPPVIADGATLGTGLRATLGTGLGSATGLPTCLAASRLTAGCLTGPSTTRCRSACGPDDEVAKVLQAAEQVLGLGGAFHYLHQLEDPDVRVAILEFATEVDGKLVEGIDKLTFDDDGLIIELKVMIRPASALQAVGAKMAEQFKAVGLGLPQ